MRAETVAKDWQAADAAALRLVDVKEAAGRVGISN